MKPFKIVAVLIFSLILWQDVSAQTFCGTDSNYPNQLTSIINQGQFLTASDNYVVRIFVHIMRKSNGTGGQTMAEVNTALNFLVTDYEAHGICFSLLGIDEIHNDTFYNQTTFNVDANGDGKFDNFSPNSHPNAIDIYLFANDKLNSGKASGIPGTALVLGGNLYSTNLVGSHVVSHEAGHCLGLFHTFHGYCNETGCPELVNGSNASTCGDFVSDTPADPTAFHMNQSTCAWNNSTCSGSTTDANGQTYNPNLTLIMAYTSPACMAQHTAGQGSRMRDMLANAAILQNVIVPNAVNVSSLTITSGQNLLYDGLNSVTISSSSVENGGTLTLRAGVNVVLSPGFHAKNGSSFRALSDEECSTVDRNNAARISNNFMQEEDSELEDGLTVFPNPFASSVNLQCKVEALSTISISIASAEGKGLKKIKDQELHGQGNYTFKLDLAEYPSGVYVCVFEKKNLETGGVVKVVRKLIKL